MNTKITMALILVLSLSGCSKHILDVQGLAEDVLKENQGVSIDIEPIEKK